MRARRVGVALLIGFLTCALIGSAAVAAEPVADTSWPGATVKRFDCGGTSRAIAKDPSKYDFTNTTAPCRPVIPKDPPAACGTMDSAEADQYMWWDEYHPTCKLAEIMANQMVKLISEAGWLS